MNKKSKIISIISISLLMISGIFVHTSFLTINTLIANKSSEPSKNNVLETPKTSDVSGSYDWGDGNSMDIETMDNTTTTTFYNQSYNYITIKSEKNDTYINTEFNETASISCDELGETPFQLHSSEYDVYLPNLNTLDIEGPDYEIQTFAAGNYEEKSLDSFYVKTYNTTSTRFLNMSYWKDSVNGYDLNLLIGDSGGHLNVSLDYDNQANAFKWRDDTHTGYSTSDFFINASGVWENNIQRIDWTSSALQAITSSVPGVWSVDITKHYNTIIFHYYSIYIGQDFYELIFTKNYDGIITMNFILLTAPVSFYWCQHTITYYNQIGVSMIIFTFYLWDIFDLLYSIMWEIAYFEVKFLWERTLLVWGSIFIELWISIDLFIAEIIISFHWAWWSYKVDIWFDIDLSIFIYYLVWIEYYYSNYHWVYSFYVPTLILPNFLTINIIESIYTEFWFYITIKVTDYLDNNVEGATISGNWGGDAIEGVDITPVGMGTGEYVLTLPAKRIGPADPSIWLNLTANKPGYANGTLNTQIAVYDQLFIDLVYFGCYNTTKDDWWFIFSVNIMNSFGTPTDPDIFGGYWNGINIDQATEIKDTGVGTYDINVTAIFVPAGPGSGITLELRATKSNFEDGSLITDIKVDPEVKNPKVEPPSEPGDGALPDDDDDDDGKEETSVILGPDFIIIGISSTIGAAAVAIYLIRKRRSSR
ncbi:MAG: hypothetical protein ACFFAH_06160 [Promethearchaeota archaeon]